MISIDYKDGRTIHEQIEARFRELIINGILKPDEQMPSVRELSVSLTVNPNTVQRAYKQLEAEGFIYSVKGKGSFVSTVKGVKNDERIEEMYTLLTTAVKELMFMGESKEKIENIIRNVYSQKEGQL